MPVDDFQPRVIKSYELTQRIGAGGFGAVYRAYQAIVRREVAIKVILPEHANHPDFIRNFEFEAQIIARLEHPHIVPLYDYWREPDGAYLVMRWLRGGSLRDALSAGPWSPKELIPLLDQIAEALMVAHRKGIVHRDIKLDNILLDDDTNAYLADFGIAKDLYDLGAEHEEKIVGSPAYMAPEQIRNQALSPRTDLYSLGIVLFEMLTGAQPFKEPTPMLLLYKHLSEPIPPLVSLRPDLPSALDSVIERATAKEPHQRFADAMELAEAFRAAVHARHTERHSSTGFEAGEAGRADKTRPSDPTQAED
ncbi:MAG: serine/threonine protein kinase, partial [Anaerolineales bacterium]|nr:serine/threonine protein kinase [Anaerolineales bacterium]